MYLFEDTSTYSQIQVLSWRYRYYLGDTGTYSVIQILTRRYRYLLGDTSTYSQMQVLPWRYRYLFYDRGTYSEINILTCRTGTYLKMKVILTCRYRTLNSLQGRMKSFAKNLFNIKEIDKHFFPFLLFKLKPK